VDSLRHLIDSNRAWAADIQRRTPDFFPGLARQQSPKYLWIGCSDSRVPANEIVGLPPVTHVCETTIVADAWERGQSLVAHGWIYGLDSGLVRDLEYSVSTPAELADGYQRALSALLS